MIFDVSSLSVIFDPQVFSDHIPVVANDAKLFIVSVTANSNLTQPVN